MYQINCAAEPLFCQDQKIHEKPDMLAFRNQKVFSYFTQKRDLSEISEQTMFDFVEELSAINPLKKHVLPPLTDVSACCDALIVTGDNIRGRGSGTGL